MTQARYFVNPFLIYIASFSLVSLLYMLPWSEHYRVSSLSTVFFILCTFVPQLVLFGATKNWSIFAWNSRYRKQNWLFICAVGAVLFLLNSLYVGQLPILAGLGGTYEQSVKEIEVMPVIYPLSSAFFFCFGCYFFYGFLCSGQKLLLLLSIMFCLFHVVFLQRGVLISQVFTMGVMFAFSKRGFSLRKLTFGAGGLVAIFIAFGLMGSLRDSSGKYYRPVTEIGGATAEFRATHLPANVFYVWLYLTSPLANFQVNVEADSFRGRERALSSFLFSEVVPDAISKRLVDLAEIEGAVNDYRIVSTLNVGTMYSRPYSYLGWLGCIFIYSIFLFLSFFYVLKLRDLNRRGSPYVVFGVAYLLVFSGLMVFDNMIPNSARFLPLLFPLVMDIFSRITLRRRKGFA